MGLAGGVIVVAGGWMGESDVSRVSGGDWCRAKRRTPRMMRNSWCVCVCVYRKREKVNVSSVMSERERDK